MKRVALASALVILLLSLACQGAATPAPTSAPKAATPAAAAQSPAAAQPTAAQKAGANQPPIKIGVPLSLTGPLADNGLENRRGIELYFKQNNNQIGGRSVQLIFEDTEAKPDVGLTKTRKLVEQDKVDVIIGYVSSSVAYAIRDYVNSSKVPTIITTAGANGLTQEAKSKSPYIYRTANTNDQEPYAMAQWILKNRPSYKRVIGLGSNFDAGKEMVAAFKAGFEKGGGTMVKEIYPPLGTSDFSPFLSQINPSEADFVWSFDTDNVPLVTQYAEVGLKSKIPLLGQGVLTQERNLPDLRDAAVGIITGKNFVATLPSVQDFVNSYKKEFNVVADGWAYQAYSAAQAYAEAVKALGGDVSDKDKVAQALGKVRFEGPLGTVYFDENRQIVFDVFIRETRKGDDGAYHNFVVERIPGVKQACMLCSN